MVRGAAFGVALALCAGSSVLLAADGNPGAGKPLYDKYCASCHGKGGKGIGTLPDLSDARYISGRTDAQLIEKITNGGKGSGMPAWGTILSEPQRHDVLAYIRTLAK